MSPLRVLFVHDVLGDLGGAEANVRASARGLRERGAEVAFLHGPGTGIGEDAFRSIFSTRFSWTEGVGLAWDAARTWGPTVIYIHKLMDVALLKRIAASGLPVAHMVHDHHLFCPRGYRYFPWNRQPCTKRAGYGCALTCAVQRARGGRLPVRLVWPGATLRALEIHRHFACHVVATRYMRDELLLNGFAAQQIEILAPAARPAPKEFVPALDQARVVFAGQLIRGKGCDVLLRALARLVCPDWHCTIIGDGDQRSTLEAQVVELGFQDRITFTGWIPQERLFSEYLHARVGVVPSMWPEPMGGIGIEFQQHGLPVVAFDAGGIRDWLHDGEDGLLVPYADEAGLALALDRVLTDRALAERLGTAGRAGAALRNGHDAYLARLEGLLTKIAAP